MIKSYHNLLTHALEIGRKEERPTVLRGPDIKELYCTTVTEQQMYVYAKTGPGRS